MNKQHKWVLILLVVLVLNGAMWFLGIDPTRSAIAQVEKQRLAQEQKVTQLSNRLVALEAIDTEALEQEQRDQLIRIPEVGLLREIMTEFEAVAIELENELLNISFSEPVLDKGYQNMEISLVMTGDYANIFAYIKYLETHSRLILVNSFNIGGEEVLSANIQLMLFSDDFDPYTPHEAPGRNNPFRPE